MNSKLIPCSCGCGELIKEYTLNGTKRKYKQGHWVLRGDKCYNWNGGKTMSIHGYIQIRIPEHPKSNNGYVLEHRYVWEQHNSASLLEWTDVHHINGDKTDNRIENLEAMMKSVHMKISQKEKRRDGLGRYAKD